MCFLKDTRSSRVKEARLANFEKLVKEGFYDGLTFHRIIPGFMIAEGWCHQGMSEIIETPDMHIRQQKMAEAGDAAIVLPGGCGSMAELFELITWKQLGLYLNPIVILNTKGYYDALLQQLEQAAEEQFMRKEHLQIWRVAQTAEEAVQLATSTPMWDTNVRRFAAV